MNPKRPNSPEFLQMLLKLCVIFMNFFGVQTDPPPPIQNKSGYADALHTNILGFLKLCVVLRTEQVTKYRRKEMCAYVGLVINIS